MEKICVLYNKEKSNSTLIYKDVLKYLSKYNFKILDEAFISKADFVFVIGGDGTFLRNFKKIKNVNTKVVAINAGSLGFLTEIRPDGYEKIIDSIVKNDLNIEERCYLEINIGDNTYIALNEIFLTRDTIKRNVVSSEIFVNDKFLGEFKGDGVIVSTPTGSTAYSLSAGGPIITPELKLFLVTPIAPHNLNTRPIIISGEKEVVLKLTSKTPRAYLNIDGNTPHKIGINDLIKIKYSTNKLKLVIPKDRNYYDVLREKLKWGENLC